MFVHLFRHSSKYCTLLKTLLPRNYSQTIVTSQQSTLTRVSRLSRDLRLFSVPHRRVSNLSCHNGKQNGKILANRNPKNFVANRGTANLHNFDVKTDTVNNVFLFKYEKPIFFKAMNIFGVFHLCFWFGISYVMYNQLPVYDFNNGPFLKYILDNFLTCVIVVLAVGLGTGASLLIGAFTARSVKYLILNKGGKDATFMMYHPYKSNTKFTIPVNDITCKTGRQQMKNYLPLKLKGRSFHYILDSGGVFVNPILFDHTASTSGYHPGKRKVPSHENHSDDFSVHESRSNKL